MMTIAELYALLLTLGLPVAYGSFTEPTAPPFITYQFAYSNDLLADNQNYVGIGVYQVELYTRVKDVAHETALQGLLRDNGLIYSKTEAYLEEEKLIQIIYQIELIGGQ